MTAFFLLLAALAALATAAFCAGAETGFLSVSRERVLHLSRAGGKKAKIVQAALSEMSRTLTTLLIGNNLAAVAYSSASAALALEVLGPTRVGNAVWSVASAFVVLYVSEFMPKMLCAARPLHRTLQMARTYRVLSLALRPLVTVLVRITDLFVPRKEQKYRVTGRDLMRILRDRKDGVCISDIESALIGRIVTCRVKGRFVMVEDLLDAVRDAD
jgi:Mg2+/Co2+ transporter CorB